MRTCNVPEAWEDDAQRNSKQFHMDEWDVLICSCDGIRFKVHKLNLHAHSEIFPGDEFASHDEIVYLSEDSSTLELLFRCMYRQSLPNLRLIGFEQLARLAEAAEKYRVSPAMEICKVSMRASISERPVAVLGYAAKHGHTDLCIEAAPMTLCVSAEEVLVSLGPAYFMSWSTYRESCVQALFDAHTPPAPGGILHRGGALECEAWRPFMLSVIDDMGQTLEALLRISSIFERNQGILRDCWHCRLRAYAWKDQVQRQIAGLPGFRL